MICRQVNECSRMALFNVGFGSAYDKSMLLTFIGMQSVSLLEQPDQ